MKKRILCALLLLSLTLSFFAGCGPTAPADPDTDPGNSTSSPTAPSLNGVALESFVIVYDLEAKNSAKRLQEEMQKSFGYQLPLLEESALTGGENVIFVGDFGPRSYGIRYGISAKDAADGTQHIYLSADTGQSAMQAVNTFLLDHMQKHTVIAEKSFCYLWSEADLAAGLVMAESSEETLADGLTYIRRNYTRKDGQNLDVYIAVISPALVPYLSLTAPTPGEVATTSTQAANAQANGKNVALAINAGFYDINATNLPSGTCIIDGIVYQRPVPSTSHKNLWFGLTNDGEAVIADATKYANVYENDLTFAVGGYKLIIQNGKFHARSSVLNPLTTVGICADGSVVFVCVDGRSTRSAGASYADIAQIYAELDAQVESVLVLDGGGSTTFVTKENESFVVKNVPSDGKERKVQSVLLVTPP